MNMTTAGKIALFVNLALSLMFAFWGFGIYSQRINWTDKKIGEREGEYAQRDVEIKHFQPAVRQRIDTLWRQTTKVVLDLEKLRPEKQKWYQEQIEILKTGNANQKILGIAFDQGRIKIDPRTGFPEMKVLADPANKPIPGLASRQILNDAYVSIQGKIVAATAEIAKLVEEEKQLTEQLGDGKVQGLRFDLAQQQLAEKRSLDEQEYLQPLLYNSMVKQQSLEDRQKALADRMKRLQASRVAKQP